VVEPIALDAVHSYNPLCISLKRKNKTEQLLLRSPESILFPNTTFCLVLLSSYLLQLHTGCGLDIRGHLTRTVLLKFSGPIVIGVKSLGTYGASVQNEYVCILHTYMSMT